MRPLQISPDTAVRLSKALGVPLEQLMHMPQHILIQKLVELEKQNKDENNTVLFRRTFIIFYYIMDGFLAKILIGYTMIQFNLHFEHVQ